MQLCRRLCKQFSDFRSLGDAEAKSARTKLYLRHSVNQADEPSLRKIAINLIQTAEHDHVYAYFNANRWLNTI